MNEKTRRMVAREVLADLLIDTVESAHELATARPPATRAASQQHYLRLEAASKDIASIAIALRLIETRGASRRSSTD